MFHVTVTVCVWKGEKAVRPTKLSADAKIRNFFFGKLCVPSLRPHIHIIDAQTHIHTHTNTPTAHNLFKIHAYKTSYPFFGCLFLELWLARSVNKKVIQRTKWIMDFYIYYVQCYYVLAIIHIIIIIVRAASRRCISSTQARTHTHHYGVGCWSTTTNSETFAPKQPRLCRKTINIITLPIIIIIIIVMEP